MSEIRKLLVKASTLIQEWDGGEKMTEAETCITQAIDLLKQRKFSIKPCGRKRVKMAESNARKMAIDLAIYELDCSITKLHVMLGEVYRREDSMLYRYAFDAMCYEIKEKLKAVKKLRKTKAEARKEKDNAEN